MESIIFSRRREVGGNPISHVLLDPNEEIRLGVRNYIENPKNLLLDLDKIDEGQSILVKVIGKVASLDIERRIAGSSSYHDSLIYNGFINVGFPLYFSNEHEPRSSREVPSLKLETKMLKAAKNIPIVMTGELIKNDKHSEFIYELYPFVLKLGKYVSPKL